VLLMPSYSAKAWGQRVQREHAAVLPFAEADYWSVGLGRAPE
jgi:hypothetical protein